MKVLDSFERRSAVRSVDPLDDPIEFIRQEHDYQFEMCGQLDELFNSLGLEPVDEGASVLRRFLLEDLPRHIKDEEDDLFPMLLRRCTGHDGLEVILAQLLSEHETDLGLVDPILKELDLILDGGTPLHPDQFLANSQTFAETQRRHLIWENSVVLPLAEKRLTVEDKMILGRGLAARRPQ